MSRKTPTQKAVSAIIIGTLGVTSMCISSSAVAVSETRFTTALTTQTVDNSQTPSTMSRLMWLDVAQKARNAGDIGAAEAAMKMANKQPTQVGTQGVGGIAKKAIKSLLKYGRNYLPKKLRPYADKIYDALEALDNWVEGPIITALMQAGVPYDVAAFAAQWIVTFAV